VLTYDINVEKIQSNFASFSTYSLTEHFVMYIYIRNRVYVTVEFVSGRYQIHAWMIFFFQMKPKLHWQN